MVYQRTTNKGDLLETDIYWKAEKFLEFRNRRNELFTIEPGTVFTISAEYNHRTDDYEVTVTCYGFAEGINDGMRRGISSPLAVKSKVEQRLAEDEFYALKLDLDRKCVSMKKPILETRIMNNSHVVDFCNKNDAFRKELQTLQAKADDVKRQLNSGRRQPTNIEKKISRFIDVSERVEADATSCEKLKQISQLSFVVFFMFFLLSLGASSSPNLLMVILSFAIMTVSGLNFLFGPKVAAIVVCKILSLPFVIGDFLTGSGRGQRLDRQTCLQLEDDLKMLNSELHLRTLKQLELKKELDRKFSLVNNEVFGAALPYIAPAPGQKQATPAAGQMFTVSPVPQMQEIETRTPEEITGGYERVAYPVYERNDDIPASDERKVISLTKTGRKARSVQASSGKKVDLRKH